MDLYLCPRLLRKKVNVTDPTKLIPELPSPNDLKPFPVQVSIDFKFHTTTVRTIAVSPNGMFLASGDENHNLVIWNTRTTKIVRKYELPNKVIDCIEWCPNTSYCLLAATNEEQVHLIAPQLSTREVGEQTKAILEVSKMTWETESAATTKDKRHVEWVF